MPLVLFFWFFGWALYWIGSKSKMPESIVRKVDEDLKFALLLPEKEYAR